MIHHISLPAKNPLHVAEVLAELFNGYSAPFSSHSDSYVAFAADKYGTLIEVYPIGTEMIPGEGDQPITKTKIKILLSNLLLLTLLFLYRLTSPKSNLLPSANNGDACVVVAVTLM
ncbi:hypothetical protein H1P_6540001 [Hyella patelloides LEGE 07179]|uniref:Uncharacterized protein n=1 Tax=Hyella patelloides LEGE 07179 TaxID=945734 RepID=A0A563W2L1_9CYAN|nr:hypothetical protein [Hyella patelloides]VEP17890.1 hypothetical protein H1P_6540001 [Hyella patelloides LEGE 07179]